MLTIDLICPVYREQEVINLFHDQLSAVASDLGERYNVRIIYILDPSPDRSELELVNISVRDKRVQVLVMSRRFGHQAALMAGIDNSHADAIVMLDSDLQHPPQLIPQLVARWEQGADIVQAVRQDGTETGLFKRLTSRWFYQLLLRVGAVEVPIGASDFRLMTKRAAAVLREQLPEQNPFLRGLVAWVGFNAVNVPYTPARRQHGRSNYRTSTLINFALNGLFSFSKVPLRFCIGFGLMVAFLSFIGGVFETLVYMFGTVYVPGWSTLIVALCFLGGVQLFFLGIIGEYVGLIFDEVKARPRYIINRRYINGAVANVEARTPNTISQLNRPTVPDHDRVALR